MKIVTKWMGIPSLMLLMASFVLPFACSSPQGGPSPLSQDQLVERGKYLVNAIGCADCHSPKIMTPQGPVPDSSLTLSGHPAQGPVPPLDTLFQSRGIMIAGPDLTTFEGPWGYSFAANLTPDPNTGIGNWTSAIFIKAIRTGKINGLANERTMLPPMPYMDFNTLNDQDLTAIFTYLKTLPPIHNPVPSPLPPGVAPK